MGKQGMWSMSNRGNAYEQERSGMIEEMKDGDQEIVFESLIRWAREINSRVLFDFIRET